MILLSCLIAWYSCFQVTNMNTGKSYTECQVRIEEKVYRTRGQPHQMQGWAISLHNKYNRKLIWKLDVKTDPRPSEGLILRDSTQKSFP